MKNLYLILTLTLTLMSCSDITSHNTKTPGGKNTSVSPSSIETDSDVWVGAYLATYKHYVQPTGNWGNLPTEGIDWDAFTHLFYFSLHAETDGSLSPIEPYRNMSPDRINSIVTAAHDHDKAVLYTIGGWGNYEGFSNAIKPDNRSYFVANIVDVLQTWNFDGVDIDMEPIRSGDIDNYTAFINELYTALKDVTVSAASKPLLTAATNSHPEMYAQLEDKFDQINLMTYDLSGAWQGWVTWHNAAVYSSGNIFPGTGKPLPSVDQRVKAFIDAGVPASKLGIGIDFYGYIWSGGSGTSTGGATVPNQDWETAPTVTGNIPYHDIMNKYYDPAKYHWDESAKGAYLSFDEEGSANDKFITYDDERSIKAKFGYVRKNNLGGTIIWELGGGYREDQPAGERDKLLKAVKEAKNNSSLPDIPLNDTQKPTVSFITPLDGAILSGTVNTEIQADDNMGVKNIELFLDGLSVESFSSAPYLHSWQTTTHINHTCTLTAEAVDQSGNRSSRSISVDINNLSEVTNPNNPTSELTIYDESLNGSWINSSWNATLDYENSERAYSGGRSIKVTQKKWGALSVRSGSWSSDSEIQPSQYQFVEIAVYAPNDDARLSMRLENANRNDFPKVSYGTVPADQWVIINIPLTELNPDGHTFNRINIFETSGATKTYFVDDIILTGNGSSTSETFVNIFADGLESPWLNSSWNATVDFTNSRQVANGSQAIKIDQQKWGGFSLLSGSWSNTAYINTTDIKRMEFKIYATQSANSFSISLKADNPTPKYQLESVTANTWTTVSIPMEKLNPNSYDVFRLQLSETSGLAQTYYIDDLRFVK